MRLLLLIPSTSYKAVDFLKAAEQLEVELLVGCNRHQTLEAISPGNLLTLDFHDLEQSTQKVIQLVKEKPISAVVSTDDDGALLAATISESLSIPHNPISAIAATRDKAKLRKRLTAANLPSPSFQVFSTKVDPEEISDQIDYPVVLKPTGLSGSQGVIRANHPEAFCHAFKRIKALFKNTEIIEKYGKIPKEILVEEYIPGQEVAFEGLLQKGQLLPLALFDKPDPLEGPFFEETLYITPSRLPSSLQNDIVHSVQRGINTLGLTEGPIHAELRVHLKVPVIIEIAARSIGGHCSRILQFGIGVSLETLLIKHALGLPIRSLERETVAAGVMMVPIPRRGIFVDVQGLADAKQVDGVTDVEIVAHRNQEIIPLPEGHSYLGFIFAKAQRPELVESALREAHQNMRITIRPT
ncbi:ATP-grasp domain-containing protein [Nitrospira defluvii]|nr:ATP-grasp domain-containing protein [Nitrospira defluvii]